MNNALVRACLLRYQSAELLLVPNAASILLIDSATHELVDVTLTTPYELYLDSPRPPVPCQVHRCLRDRDSRLTID